MFSSHTNSTYYIGTKVKEISTGKEGKVYAINVLRTIGLRIVFNDKTKKAYFGDQLSNLIIIT